MYEISTNRLLKTYDKILKVNLTNDSYIPIKVDTTQEKNIDSYDYFSQWISGFALEGNVYSDDVLVYQKYTSISFLRDFFKENDNHWVQYRRKYGDNYYWCEMVMLTAEDYTNDNQQIYLFVKKMNNANYQNSFEGHQIKKSVLIFDDKNCSDISEALYDSYNVLSAETIEQAASHLKDNYENIVAVIVKINSNDDYLLDLVKAFKRNSRYDSIPIIVAIDKYSTKLANQYLENGAFDFIVKPYNKDLIKSKLDSLSKLRYSISVLNTLKKDPLTGLYSKDVFFKKVEEILDLTPSKKYRMVCTDIESFRHINESYGTDVGDKVLRYVAEHVTDVLPNVLLAGRISSDIFAFFREDVPFEYDNEKWKAFRQNAPVPHLVVKYGICDYDRNKTVQTICDYARLAAKSIKQQYDRPFAKFTEEMQQQKNREQKVIDAMELALQDEEFKVFYQPKHNASNRSISGAEALVRWVHNDLGFLSPAEFIPLFEKNGFIAKLDEYVIENVCKDLARWIKQEKKVVPISTNLSRRDFENDNLVDLITGIADKYNIPHRLLHLEVTESAFTTSSNNISTMIKKLRENGFVIELDDFGSGYSSLTMLNDIELDILKIDRSILNKKSADDSNKVLDFCIQLGKMLGLKTVAEGVETEEELNLLISLGCDYIQGYLFSKPLPVNEFEQYMDNCQ